MMTGVQAIRQRRKHCLRCSRPLRKGVLCPRCHALIMEYSKQLGSVYVQRVPAKTRSTRAEDDVSPRYTVGCCGGKFYPVPYIPYKLPCCGRVLVLQENGP
jgi:hypothetical protein